MKLLHCLKKKLYILSGLWIGSRYIYRELLGPFILSISVVTFILLVNFLIRSIDRLLGKGLSGSVIFEFLYLNLAWIIAMSVPMAVLVACIMAYGRLAEDNEITAMRASGISFLSILTPGVVFGLMVTGAMIFFQNNILPDFNHRARMLSYSIYRKRPDLNLEPGYFLDDLPDYSIYTREKVHDLLKQVVIYSKDNSRIQTTIYADSGRLNVAGSNILFTLFSGEIHELNLDKSEEYRRMNFDRHVISIPVDNMELDRQESGRRGDREMNIAMMQEKVDKYSEELLKVRDKIKGLVTAQLKVDEVPEEWPAIDGLIKQRMAAVKDSLDGRPEERETRKLKNLVSRLKGEMSLLISYQKQVSKYQVEIHKKIAMPFACLVFVLIGSPLGVMSRKGGAAMAAVISIIFFLIYYIFLIGGEELADELYITPFWAMWSANIIIAIAGIYLTYRATWEQTMFSGFFRRLSSLRQRWFK